MPTFLTARDSKYIPVYRSVIRTRSVGKTTIFSLRWGSCSSAHNFASGLLHAGRTQQN